MTGRRFVTVDVFTDRRFGGNPLAVLPEADGLDTDAMQAIAREFNLSETAFVLAAPDAAHDARVRIFTPRSELAFAGHPNVGTALVLARLGKTSGDRLRFAELAGTVEARLARDASGTVTGATIDAPRPFRRKRDIAPARAAAAASLAAADIVVARHAPCAASVGTTIAFAEVTAAALNRAAPDAAAFAALGLTTIYVYATTGPDTVTARLFAPCEGIPEDPATGSAAATLGALLLSLEAVDRRRLVIAQGEALDRPSRMEVRAWRDGDAIRASVGGDCVVMSEGRLLLG